MRDRKPKVARVGEASKGQDDGEREQRIAASGETDIL
jgi:hypothetical protein